MKFTSRNRVSDCLYNNPGLTISTLHYQFSLARRSISANLAVDDVGVKLFGHDSQTPGVEEANISIRIRQEPWSRRGRTEPGI